MYQELIYLTNIDWEPTVNQWRSSHVLFHHGLLLPWVLSLDHKSLDGHLLPPQSWGSKKCSQPTSCTLPRRVWDLGLNDLEEYKLFYRCILPPRKTHLFENKWLACLPSGNKNSNNPSPWTSLWITVRWFLVLDALIFLTQTYNFGKSTLPPIIPEAGRDQSKYEVTWDKKLKGPAE